MIHQIDKNRFVDSLKIIYQIQPDLIEGFLNDYCKANNLTQDEFDGDFEKLYDKLTKNGKLKVKIPDNMMGIFK